jgi:hypothetical protein
MNGSLWVTYLMLGVLPDIALECCIFTLSVGCFTREDADTFGGLWYSIVHTDHHIWEAGFITPATMLLHVLRVDSCRGRNSKCKIRSLWNRTSTRVCTHNIWTVNYNFEKCNTRRIVWNVHHCLYTAHNVFTRQRGQGWSWKKRGWDGALPKNGGLSWILKEHVTRGVMEWVFWCTHFPLEKQSIHD